MKKLFISIMVLAFNLACAVTYRENEVVFKKGVGVDSLSAQFEEAKVTNGQNDPNWDKQFKYMKEDSKELKLVYSAGRKHSKEVADWFNKGSGNNAIADSYFASNPSELNFAIKNTFKINGSEVAKPFYIAQGSAFFTNNWWVGTKDMKIIPKAEGCGQVVAIFKTNDGTEYYINVEGNNTFKVAKGPLECSSQTTY